MVSDLQEDRGWLWATLFVVMGVLQVADYFYDTTDDPYRLLTGLGFLFIAPQAFFRPVRFTKLSVKTSIDTPFDWLALVGILLLVVGLVVRWL